MAAHIDVQCLAAAVPTCSKPVDVVQGATPALHSYIVAAAAAAGMRSSCLAVAVSPTTDWTAVHSGGKKDDVSTAREESSGSGVAVGE